MHRTWVAIVLFGCCAGLSFVMPSPYLAFWHSFAHDIPLADRVGIAVSLVGLFGVQISAAVRVALFARGRELRLLQSDVEIADDRRRAAEAQVMAREDKLASLEAIIQRLERATPSGFLSFAMLRDSGRATRSEVIPILREGLASCAPPLARAAQLLARKLLEQIPVDLATAEYAARVAAILSPSNREDRELASATVELRAADAAASGTLVSRV